MVYPESFEIIVSCSYSKAIYVSLLIKTAERIFSTKLLGYLLVNTVKHVLSRYFFLAAVCCIKVWCLPDDIYSSNCETGIFRKYSNHSVYTILMKSFMEVSRVFFFVFSRFLKEIVFFTIKK